MPALVTGNLNYLGPTPTYTLLAVYRLGGPSHHLGGGECNAHLAI